MHLATKTECKYVAYKLLLLFLVHIDIYEQAQRRFCFGILETLFSPSYVAHITTPFNVQWIFIMEHNS